MKTTDSPGWRDEYPFESHYLPLDGTSIHQPKVRMHYVDERPASKSTNSKTQSTILCVHGNPTWSFYYRSIVTAFRSQCRIVAVDHVGCGLSDKPQSYHYCLAQHTTNLVQLIDALDLRNVTLVVHDWGGAVGLGAAVQRVDRLKNLVVLNTAAFPPPYIPRRIALCRLPIIGTWAMRSLNAFARAAIIMAIDRLPRLSETAREGLLAPYDSYANRVAIDRFVHDIPMSPSHPTWSVLEQLERDLPKLGDLPIQMVWGMRDWCFVPKCMERLQQAWPNARRLELSDVGHYVMEEASKEVIDVMRTMVNN
jgi:cis-3-alkyl-4-acyloxetan-2-one decarboxylase